MLQIEIFIHFMGTQITQNTDTYFYFPFCGFCVLCFQLTYTLNIIG